MMQELYCFASSANEAEILLNAGIKIIQYRNKNCCIGEQRNEAFEISSLAENFPGAKIIINDHLDIALKTKAYGLHLGQDDGNHLEILKEYKENLHIGVSIDTVEEALTACEYGAHYIGAGAVYGSQTKTDAPYMGTKLLTDICRASTVPVAAIGGICFEKLEEVLNSGAHYICVISDINNNPDPAQRIMEYQNKIKDFNNE